MGNPSHSHRLQRYAAPSGERGAFQRHRRTPPAVLLGVLFLSFTLLLTQWYAQDSQYLFLATTFQINAPTGMSSSSLTARIGTKGRQLSYPPGDGTFNGIPIYYSEKSSPRYSSVQCLGESFQPNDDEQSHISRSCLFHHLCFNTTSERFVLFASPAEASLVQHASQPSAFVSTSLYNKSVSLGPMDKNLAAVNGKWNLFKWFPDIILEDDNNNPLTTGFYELPNSMIWMPWIILAGQNPGHLLWDSFLVLFRLMTMFGLDAQNNDLLLMRMHMGQKIWGTCEMSRGIYQKCEKMVHKFLPIMGVAPKTFSSSHDFSFQVNTDTNSAGAKSDLVCAKRGVAGIGLVTDHGRGRHGQDNEDWFQHRFVGQSTILRQFRDFALRNLGISPDSQQRYYPSLSKYRIVFSVNSSSNPSRQMNFVSEIAACRAAFASDPRVKTHAVELASMSLVKQVSFISETSILVSATGGGTATATILPNGSSLILLYGQSKGLPQYLDFAIFENAGYIQPHWLPLDWSAAQRSRAIVDIMSHELERMKREMETELAS
eukprot:scaffold6610_cov163-Amphora_coffeaeformis.AAC.3